MCEPVPGLQAYHTHGCGVVCLCALAVVTKQTSKRAVPCSLTHNVQSSPWNLNPEMRLSPSEHLLCGHKLLCPQHSLVWNHMHVLCQRVRQKGGCFEENVHSVICSSV